MRKTVLLIAAIIISYTVNAQSKFTGDWAGVLKAGQDIPLIFHIDADKQTATLDVPDKKAMGIPCSKVFVNGDKISFSIDTIKCTVEGVMKDDNTIAATWMQAGASLPFELTRGNKPKVVEKPQTPVAPFPYNSEDITYTNKDKSMTYGATITYPKDNNAHATVILITGSGPQDRDESIMGHKPFAVIADHLTKNGYVVLRVDDRGVGKTSAGSPDATSADFALDVLAGIEYLKTRKEVDKKKIGLLGHSEGGIIAPLVAQKNKKDVAFVILNAGPAMNMVDLMTDQNNAYLGSLGLTDSVVKEYGKLYHQIMTIVSNSKDTADAAPKMRKAIDKWTKTTDNGIVQLTTGINNDQTRDKFAQQFIAVAANPWFKYFISYDPVPALQELSCPVLALYGEKDIQVLAAPNKRSIEAALSQSNTKNYKVIELKGANHLFQECTKCTVEEYGELDQTISPKALDIITNWMNDNVK